jgi:hypothetical protein
VTLASAGAPSKVIHRDPANGKPTVHPPDTVLSAAREAAPSALITLTETRRFQMISKTLTVALLIPLLFTTTGITHAGENRYGMRTTPSHAATMVVLTDWSDDESYVLTISRVRRVIVSETGATSVAYDMGTFHALDGPENVMVESDIADVAVTADGVQWMEFPANVDAEPPLEIPSSAERRPASVCYDIKAAGPIKTKEVETTDAFGTQRVEIGRPESLCVPASVALQGDRYFYYPAYGVAFPPPPPGPARLCFKVRAERPVLRPSDVAVATFFGSAVTALEPVREHCVEATITRGEEEEEEEGHW